MEHRSDPDVSEQFISRTYTSYNHREGLENYLYRD